MRPTVILAAVFLTLSGCGGSGSEQAASTSTRSPAVTIARAASAQNGTGEERRYISDVGEWLSNASGTSGDCTASLEGIAGVPPSERMNEVAQQAADVCRAFERGDEGAQAESDRLAAKLFGYEFAFGENGKLPRRGGRTDVSRIEPLFSKTATALTGKKTEVRCWSPRDWQRVAAEGTPYVEGEGGANELAGFAGVDDFRLQLAPDVCAPLVELAYGEHRDEWNDNSDVAFAVGTIAHESRHRAGIALESVTECYAMQDLRRAAKLLGAPARYADGLAEYYWREIYPENRGPYFTEECRDGGRLDLYPRTSVWP